MSIQFDASHLQEQLIVSRQEEQDKETKKYRMFLRALKEDAHAWEIDLTSWLCMKFQVMARFMLTDTCQVPCMWKLSDKYRGRFRVSTFVNMYRLPDPSVFEDIGYAKGESPFDRVVKTFADKGMTVRNISDTSKGYGMWLELSFSDDVAKAAPSGDDVTRTRLRRKNNVSSP
jgi:hypothetical protein